MPDNPIPLLPCPWCGSENVSLTCDDEDFEVECNYETVYCLDCYVHGPVHEQDQASAIAVWNRGPYADRLEAHADALKRHAEALKAKADEHLKKAQELLAKAEAAEVGASG